MLKSDPSPEHPLGPKKEVASMDQKHKSQVFDDPLSQTLLAPEPTPFVDPLSQTIMALKTEEKKKAETVAKEEESFIPWAARKKDILLNYTTDEVVGIQANFMEAQSRVNLVVDKQKQRLEQLEETEEALEKEILKVSQKEYIGHIEKLNEQLIKAWDTEERVKSLKIAIQCAKVLSDTSVIKFYPSKWVLITEILDTFGRLVYERIFERANTPDSPSAPKVRLPENFSPKDVPDSARETCRNWFFKIASIRELLPRLYVELAIIKCYAFLSQGAYKEVINRMCMMARGIGDPLVATYARAYIARKGREVAPEHREHLMTSFNDYLYTQQIVSKRPRFVKMLEENRLTLSDYVILYSPAIEWILQCIAHKADPNIFDIVLSKCKEGGNGLVLNHIISSFHPDYIAANADTLANLIKDSDDTFPKYKLYCSFGVCLSLGQGPQEDDKLSLLNAVWKVVTKITDPSQYMAVAEVFIDYPLTHCSTGQVNALLGDVLKHVKPDKAYENLQPQLQSLVLKILAKYHNFATIFGMTNFLPLLDLFTGSTQVEVNKAILSSFAKHQHRTRDPVVINCMFGVSKIVHDSVNTLSFQDEIRQISHMISRFIMKIDFGRDVTKQLDFYGECRRAFGNLDPPKAQLVLAVCSLAMKTLTLANGNHSKKTAAFVRACIAYCFVTIPSMNDITQRLQLYVLAGQVALLNQSLPQADSLFKAAIALLQEMPTQIEESDGRLSSTEDIVLNFMSTFASVLVTVPGHPEHGPFYLVKGLLQVAIAHNWQPTSPAKALLLTRLLALFSALHQSALPYHAAKVESNDVLYAGDEAYNTELLAIIDELIKLILKHLESLSADQSPQAQKRQVTVALYLFDHTLRFCQLNAKSATLAANLFQLARKCGALPEDLNRSLRYLQTSDVHVNNKLSQELLKKLQF